MAYSVVADLLIGDVQVGSLLDPQKFINDAFDEMMSRIGMRYEVPLPELPAYLTTLLKLINNRIASGRLIMAAATASQDRELHAYGESLVRDGHCDLKKILDGEVELEGAVPRDTGNYGLGPSVLVGDTDSRVTYFEEYVSTPAGVPIILVDGGGYF